MLKNLTYYVQGSAKNPYKVTIVGSGENLQTYCTCPAGRKANFFCKHVASLLIGDITNFIEEGSDDLKELVKRTKNSPLEEHALYYLKSHDVPKTINIATLDEMKSYLESLKSSASFCVSIEEGKNASKHLKLFLKDKKGNYTKHPNLTLSYEKIGQRCYYLDSDDLVVEKYEKQKPYLFKGISYSKIENAATKFVEELKRLLSE